MKNIIIIEGIIGAGKTTFSKILAEELEAIWLKEPDEENGNPYLARFYKDPKRWALTMQMHLLNVRYKMHLNAQFINQYNNKNVVLDRSYFGDTAFARLQLNNGSINNDEYNTYKLFFNNMTSLVLLPKMCIYLDTSPDVASKRINKRMELQTGRTCENAIDLSYLQMLQIEEVKVIDYLDKKGVEVIRIDWNDDYTMDQIREKIKDIIENKINNIIHHDLL